jgi:hypothetical protein
MPDAAPGGTPSSTRAMPFSVRITSQEPAFSLPPAAFRRFGKNACGTLGPQISVLHW